MKNWVTKLKIASHKDRNVKKIIVGAMALMLGACSAFQSTQSKQEHEKAFTRMYCAAAHQEIGVQALKSFKHDNDIYSEESMENYFLLSGMEVQHAVIHYHKATLRKPFDIFQYNDSQNELGKNFTLEDLAEEMGYKDAVIQARNEVRSKYNSLAKNGNPFIFDDIDAYIGDKCDDAIADDDEELSSTLKNSPEANITVAMTGQCVGFYNAMSTIAAESKNDKVAINMAHHAGLMQAFMYAYISDNNAELAYDRMSVAEDKVYDGKMNDADVSKQIEDCAGVYRTANQYVVETIVNK